VSAGILRNLGLWDSGTGRAKNAGMIDKLDMQLDWPDGPAARNKFPHTTRKHTLLVLNRQHHLQYRAPQTPLKFWQAVSFWKTECISDSTYLFCLCPLRFMALIHLRQFGTLHRIRVFTMGSAVLFSLSLC